MSGFKLLSVANTKTLKGEGLGYRTYILHLAPWTTSGYQVCPMASGGCASACLFSAGRGKFNSVRAARIRKTQLFFQDRPEFMKQLGGDIRAAIRQAERLGLVPVFRLNGTSDIRWETVPFETFPNVLTAFPDQRFYDYSKLPNRRNLPPNYSLTFSRSEANESDAVRILGEGLYNVAVVFSGNLPETWKGFPVVSGDDTDLRFLDPTGGHVIGLKAKGDAKKDFSGFVVAS
jgi:hypothetical protein